MCWWLDAFMCVTWLTLWTHYACVTSCVLKCESCYHVKHIMCDMTHITVMSHIRMSRVTHLNESCHTYERVMAHIRVSHATHTNESCHTYKWVMSHIWISHVIRVDESWLTSHHEGAKHCNTLQHTATHRNTLQQTATHCKQCITLPYAATGCLPAIMERRGRRQKERGQLGVRPPRFKKKEKHTIK
jgi:hypothetical protein